jgi:hypothetical protein
MAFFKYKENEISRSNDHDLSRLIGNCSFLLPIPTSKYWDGFFPQCKVKEYQVVRSGKPFAEEYISNDEMKQRYLEIGLKD